MNFTELMGTGCIARHNTANLNNYLFTTNGGTGPAYSDMCVGVTQSTGGNETDARTPFALIGDGRYHKYTVDWHTGGVVAADGTVTEGRVDYYVDDVFLVRRWCVLPTIAEWACVEVTSPRAAGLEQRFRTNTGVSTDIWHVGQL